MRSTLICEKSNDTAHAYARKISCERWARPLTSRIWSSKCSTPKLSRVTPIFRMAVSLRSVNVPGSHSNVISSAWFHELVAFSLFTRPPS